MFVNWNECSEFLDDLCIVRVNNTKDLFPGSQWEPSISFSDLYQEEIKTKLHPSIVQAWRPFPARSKVVADLPLDPSVDSQFHFGWELVVHRLLLPV